MPNRILRDGILNSEAVNKLPPIAELFYRRLMSVVDDHGRFFAHPAILRASCYPMQLEQVKESDISTWLEACTQKIHTSAGDVILIAVYVVSGKKYLQINNFKQRVRSDSKFPAPCPHDDGHDDGQSADTMTAQCQSRRAHNDRLDGDVVVGVGVGGDDARASARTNGKSPEISDWLIGLARAHPNKRSPQIGIQMLSNKPWIHDQGARDQFAHDHEVWCKSDLWTWANGAKCPPFGEFVADYELTYQGQAPPQHASEEDW